MTTGVPSTRSTPDRKSVSPSTACHMRKVLHRLHHASKQGSPPPSPRAVRRVPARLQPHQREADVVRPVRRARGEEAHLRTTGGPS